MAKPVKGQARLLLKQDPDCYPLLRSKDGRFVLTVDGKAVGDLAAAEFLEACHQRRVFLEINRKFYLLTFLYPNKGMANPAWRLTKTDGSSFEVAATPHGHECNCPDFLYRRNHKEIYGCKHVAACRVLGLLKAGFDGRP